MSLEPVRPLSLHAPGTDGVQAPLGSFSRLHWLYEPVRRALWWVLLATLVAAGGTYYYQTKLVKPTYQATATVEVDVSQVGTAGGVGGFVADSQVYAPTAAQLIDTQVVAGDALYLLRHVWHDHHIPGGLTPAGLLGYASISVVPNSQLVDIAVTSRDPIFARDVANAFAQSGQNREAFLQNQKFVQTEKKLNNQVLGYKNQISLLQARPHPPSAQIAADITAISNIKNSLDNLSITEAESSTTLTKASPATKPLGPVGPHPLRAGILAGFLAFAILLTVVLLREYFATTLRTPEEMAAALGGAPVLGAILKLPSKVKGSGPVATAEPRSATAEGLRVIRTNLLFANVDAASRIILISSGRQGEGKSTVTANLGASMAELGGRILLVDADLRRPSLHNLLQIDDRTGLTNALVAGDNHSLETSIHGTQVHNLEVMPSGPIPPNPAELLSSGRMRDLLHRLAGIYDTVIVDSPPLLAVADAAILSTMADCVLIVTDVNQATLQSCARVRDALERVGAHPGGVVLNKLSDDRRGAYYYNYYYRQDYGYGYAPGGAASAKRGRKKAGSVQSR